MAAGVVERSVRTGPSYPGGSAPMPAVVRYGLIACGSALWFAGLWSQFHSMSAIATYLTLSLLMVVVVAL